MSLWTDRHAATISRESFRGHNQYLEQAADYPYLDLSRWCADEHPDLCELLTEDGAFGAVTAVGWEGKTVSRDLLDSIVEIGFLRGRVPGLRGARVLDIGAGYGRFAHRLCAAYPTVRVICTDPIEISRTVCARYLDERNVRRAVVVAPDFVDWMAPLALAVNIHCWSECSLEEVRGWLDWLERTKVETLFVVPHTPEFLTYEGPSYRPELDARGFRETHHWRGPECWPRDFYLFRREVSPQ